MSIISSSRMGCSWCPALFSALLALLSLCAHGAPAGGRIHRQLEHGARETLALQLNSEARHLYKQVKKEIPDVLTAVTEPPLMIRPEDKCDPESLLKNHEPCLLRVTLALKNYSRIFGDVGLFKEECTKCSKWKANASAVVEVTRKLLGELEQKIEAAEPLNLEDWMIEGLLQDSVNRLYSFSIITARVFSFLSHLHQKTVNENIL